MGSASFTDAWRCGCSDSCRHPCAKLGPGGGEGQRGGLGDSGRTGAGLGRARRTTATTRGPAATTTTPSNDTQLRRARADMGRIGAIGSALRTHRPGGSDLGCRSPSRGTAPRARAVLGRAWSRRAGRAAGPHLGLARARSVFVGAASATVMGCAQARSPTPAGGAIVGQ